MVKAVERTSQANDVVIDLLVEFVALIENVRQSVVPDQPGVIDNGPEGVENLSLRSDEFIKFFLGER